MTRTIKISLIVFAIIVIIAAIIVGGGVLYMNFFGPDAVKKSLANMLGTDVQFESMFLDKEKVAVDFKGFSILSKINLEENIFDAESFTIHLNKEKFEKDKEIIVEEIVIKKGVLNIERNTGGILNLSDNSRRTNRIGALAYAAEPQGAMGGLYGLATKFKELTVEDSVVNFKDYYVATPPLAITCDNLNLKVTSRQKPTPQTGSIPIECALNFEIPSQRYGSGEVFFKASMAVYPTWVDMDTTLETKHIDVMRFLPYFEKHTPFSFNEGFFNSSTHFEVHNSVIKSLTTMVFHRISLVIDPRKRNTTFLKTSVNKLIPYLKSGQGEIVFDFVINGPADNPEVGLGPQVKFAVGMVVMEELGGLMREMQKFQK